MSVTVTETWWMPEISAMVRSPRSVAGAGTVLLTSGGDKGCSPGWAVAAAVVTLYGGGGLALPLAVRPLAKLGPLRREVLGVGGTSGIADHGGHVASRLRGSRRYTFIVHPM
jgi:hypothetical protein